MTTNQTKPKPKELILETVKTEKLQNTNQLVQFMQQRYNIAPDATTKLLIELENENLIGFTRKKQLTPTNIKNYVNSKNAAWFWITIAIAAATTTAVFTIPETAYPIVYLRQALAIVFVLFLPGFTFIKALFPTSTPIKTRSEELDKIERVALSIVMSLALVPIVGLILNYSPWGITLTPITLSLLGLTVVFASAALIREHQAKTTLPDLQT